MRRGLSRFCAGLACALAAATAPAAARAADFYAGKTIEFLVGGDVGGGYDIYARTIGRHLPRFIPGNPAIVPKNQPGAGSGRAAAYLYAVAPKDGTTIGAVFPGAIMAPLLDDRAQPLFEPAKFQYLASADNATRVCITHERSKVRSFEDAQRQKAIMGASAAGGSTRDYAVMHRKSAGAMFELVSGYKGTADILLAVERGEVDGLCGLDWSSLKSQRPDWLRNKSVNILLQVNLEPEAELARLGVPQMWRYIAREEDRKAVELVIGQQVFGRPYLAPPGVPAEQVGTLRAAFAATMADKDFLADAEKTRIDVVPSSGEEVQRLVERLYAAPKPVVERAKELLRP
jgi:tripartite-type tricarboxylate transporter receptor subunit TctC